MVSLCYFMRESSGAKTQGGQYLVGVMFYDSRQPSKVSPAKSVLVGTTIWVRQH